MPVEGKVGSSSKRPTKPVLIYDADCAFCARWVQRLRHWDHKRRVTYLPLRDDRALAVSGRERQKLQIAVHLVRPDGAVFAGAAAARELCAFLPLGSLPRVVMSLPGVMPIATRVYAWIARRYGPVRQ
jgi:predicted DCC family thiol-disulfide oxidoreductase YuxK